MNQNTYTTDQMMDLITIKDKDLVFEAINGKYDGQVVCYHEDIGKLMWKFNNLHEPITLTRDFMITKWKILSGVYAFQVNMPLMDFGKVCCLVN